LGWNSWAALDPRLNRVFQFRHRRTKNPRVAIRKAVKQKKMSAAAAAAIIDFWLHTLVQFLADVSGRYRGNPDGWLPDQGSNLGPAD